MKKLKLFIILFFFIYMTDNINSQDWADLKRFEKENSQLSSPKENEDRVVFMGNSIFEGWSKFQPALFIDNPYINRGISGQTTPQMLIRFRSDVINLKPKVVVILAGTNDIAGNTGPSSLEMIMDNLISMVELAKSNNIKTILCSVLPAYDYPWRSGMYPNEKIPALNKMIKEYAKENEIYYLDFFSKMANEKNGLIDEYTYDGVHPNETGYKVMQPLIEDAIYKVLFKN